MVVKRDKIRSCTRERCEKWDTPRKNKTRI